MRVFLNFNSMIEHPVTTIIISSNETLPAVNDIRRGIWLFMAPLGESPKENKVMSKAERLLAPDELQRANAFVLPVLRMNYVLGRALLRILLTRYGVGTCAQAIRFYYNIHGKPFIEGKYTDDMLPHFSVSHTDHRILVAITHETTPGVDIERVLRHRTTAGVARMCFSKNEFELYNEYQKPTWFFYRLWSRKEAWLKSVGIGLVDDLPSLEVLEEEPIYRGMPTGYTCQSLLLEENCAAALSYPVRGVQLPIMLCRLDSMLLLF